MPDDQTPSLEDQQLFLDIAADLKARPDFYREAGTWLDENFSDAAFTARAQTERSELLHKSRAGQTTEARQVVARLQDLRADDAGELALDEAFALAIDLARKTHGMSEKRFIKLTERERTGHLAPDANLRPMTEDEKAKWPGLSEAEKDKWRKSARLAPAQKKKRDDDRTALYAVYQERDRLQEIIRRYFHGDLSPGEYRQLKRSKGNPVPTSRMPLYRFSEAIRYYAESPPPFPGLDEAKRVLLLAWLMTDPGADNAGLGLTDFENWPWDVGEVRSAGNMKSRRYAAEFLWAVQGEIEERRAEWWKLVRKAWLNVGSVRQVTGKENADSKSHNEVRCDAMSRTEIAKRYLNRKKAKPNQAEQWMNDHDLRQEPDGLWTVRIDDLDPRIRKRFEQPLD